MLGPWFCLGAPPPYCLCLADVSMFHYLVRLCLYRLASALCTTPQQQTTGVLWVYCWITGRRLLPLIRGGTLRCIMLHLSTPTPRLCVCWRRQSWPSTTSTKQTTEARRPFTSQQPQCPSKPFPALLCLLLPSKLFSFTTQTLWPEIKVGIRLYI